MKVAAVVVGVALALGLGIWLGRRPSSDWIAVSPSPQSPHEVILTDGSTVRLPQPCERLFVRYSRHSRDLRMQECSAEFKVTRGDDRTFRVAVIGGTIEARGTEFGVRWTGQSSDVWVIEGRVVVRGASEPGKPIDLAGKESAELSADGHVPVVMRKFENVTLMEVAKAYTEVHSMPQFQFKDGSASLRFSGTVNVADADNIIGIFPTYPELEVERSGDVVTVRMDK
jgi:ferric-dicitrate binding protein FerR (iron transport regulator)